MRRSVKRLAFSEDSSRALATRCKMWTLILAIADPTNPHIFGPVLVMEPDAMGSNQWY